MLQYATVQINSLYVKMCWFLIPFEVIVEQKNVFDCPPSPRGLLGTYHEVYVYVKSQGINSSNIIKPFN